MKLHPIFLCETRPNDPSDDPESPSDRPISCLIISEHLIFYRSVKTENVKKFPGVFLYRRQFFSKEFSFGDDPGST